MPSCSIGFCVAITMKPRESGVGRAVDRDRALLHRLEQRGLRLRRRAVDLVREEDVGEDRPLASGRTAFVWKLKRFVPSDVARHEVGRELDAAEADPERRPRRRARAGSSPCPARPRARTCPSESSATSMRSRAPVLPHHHLVDLSPEPLGRRRGSSVELHPSSPLSSAWIARAARTASSSRPVPPRGERGGRAPRARASASPRPRAAAARASQASGPRSASPARAQPARHLVLRGAQVARPPRGPRARRGAGAPRVVSTRKSLPGREERLGRARPAEADEPPPRRGAPPRGAPDTVASTSGKRRSSRARDGCWSKPCSVSSTTTGNAAPAPSRSSERERERGVVAPARGRASASTSGSARTTVRHALAGALAGEDALVASRRAGRGARRRGAGASRARAAAARRARPRRAARGGPPSRRARARRGRAGRSASGRSSADATPARAGRIGERRALGQHHEEQAATPRSRAPTIAPRARRPRGRRAARASATTRRRRALSAVRWRETTTGRPRRAQELDERAVPDGGAAERVGREARRIVERVAEDAEEGRGREGGRAATPASSAPRRAERAARAAHAALRYVSRKAWNRPRQRPVVRLAAAPRRRSARRSTAATRPASASRARARQRDARHDLARGERRREARRAGERLEGLEEQGVDRLGEAPLRARAPRRSRSGSPRASQGAPPEPRRPPSPCESRRTSHDTARTTATAAAVHRRMRRRSSSGPSGRWKGRGAAGSRGSVGLVRRRRAGSRRRARAAPRRRRRRRGGRPSPASVERGGGAGQGRLPAGRRARRVLASPHVLVDVGALGHRPARRRDADAGRLLRALLRRRRARAPRSLAAAGLARRRCSGCSSARCRSSSSPPCGAPCSRSSERRPASSSTPSSARRWSLLGDDRPRAARGRRELRGVALERPRRLGRPAPRRRSAAASSASTASPLWVRAE